MTEYIIACSAGVLPYDLYVTDGRCYVEFYLGSGTINYVANVFTNKIPNYIVEDSVQSRDGNRLIHRASFPVRKNIIADQFKCVI
jgi:hypothetical protein